MAASLLEYIVREHGSIERVCRRALVETMTRDDGRRQGEIDDCCYQTYTARGDRSIYRCRTVHARHRELNAWKRTSERHKRDIVDGLSPAK